MKRYAGSRDRRGDAFVAVIDETHEAKALDLGLKYVRHSPLNHFNDAELASRFYQDFKFAVISNLPMDSPWELTTEQVEDALETIRAKREIREEACRDIT